METSIYNEIYKEISNERKVVSSFLSCKIFVIKTFMIITNCFNNYYSNPTSNKKDEYFNCP